jgi:hypothetical protein
VTCGRWFFLNTPLSKEICMMKCPVSEKTITSQEEMYESAKLYAEILVKSNDEVHPVLLGAACEIVAGFIKSKIDELKEEDDK